MKGWMFNVGYREVTVGPVEYDKMGAVETRLLGDGLKCANYARRVRSVTIHPNELACREAAARDVRDRVERLRQEIREWDSVLAELEQVKP